MKSIRIWMLIPMFATISCFILSGPAIAASASQAQPASAVSAEPTAGPKVNINSADVETLCTLKGIGPALALRIKEFREQHGPFKTPEDITQVRGVGNTILEWNKNMIEVK